ncbi:hypothetical protein BC938DRAFT_476651 [Jimgerdemannia flammicorona]|uniref:Uncharacterized protein n=1 Tax=Jimgerdemannia flammicorona TaxID=994334 RepID=A0A433PFE6_9FUNG|nr:hypothetical protein BC938DRAFT_476651 [Jimgerdemannia flammicorona]
MIYALNRCPFSSPYYQPSLYTLCPFSPLELIRPLYIHAELLRGTQSPPGIPQELPGQQHNIRLSLDQDLLSLLGIRDDPHGGRQAACLLLDLFRERHLVPGPDGVLRGRERHVAAARHVHEVNPRGVEPLGELDRLLNVPAVGVASEGAGIGGGVVGSRNAHEEGLLLGPDGANGGDCLEKETDAIFERSAIFVGALVGITREELVRQVPVRAVQFEHVDARGVSALGGGGEGGGYAVDILDGESVRLGVGVIKGNIRGGPNVVGPAALLAGGEAGGLPERESGGLAAGVANLDADEAALLVDEVGDTADWLDLGVLPETRIRRRDAPLRFDGRGLDTDETGSLEGKGPEMHQVEVI